MVFRDNETLEATASRLETAKLNIAAARRSQSPTTSRGTRAAATAAMSKFREQQSPEESQVEKEKNTLSKALKRKMMPEDQKAKISKKKADSKRRMANQR